MVVYDHGYGVEFWGVGVVVCDLGEEMEQTESQSVKKREKVGGKECTVTLHVGRGSTAEWEWG